jgi:hypothetical protein
MNSAPSGYAASTRRPHHTASAVFPTPAIPVTTQVPASPRSAASTVATSAARPVKCEVTGGRLKDVLVVPSDRVARLRPPASDSSAVSAPPVASTSSHSAASDGFGSEVPFSTLLR